MGAKESITHPGIVDHVTENSVFVMVLAKSACSSCHAKGMCNIAEMEEKLVEVKKDQNRNFSKGDGVTVSMNKSQGGKAVLLGYIVPFFLLIAVLVGVLLLSGNEGVAGLSAILILIPYYWLLYKYRDRLKQTVSFSIE